MKINVCILAMISLINSGRKMPVALASDGPNLPPGIRAGAKGIALCNTDRNALRYLPTTGQYNSDKKNSGIL